MFLCLDIKNMEHVAIMKKSWGFIEKILGGQKTIESRWYSLKSKPWDNIKGGEIIYFKNSGESINMKAEVSKVIQFTDLTPNKVKKILNKYGKAMGIESGKISEFFESFKDKKYCILIFIKNPREIKPFNINKKGFGMMSAWICVDNVDELKK
ncbi:MAG: hypothetical protein AAB334_01345 [Patescibacteria group bacterium]